MRSRWRASAAPIIHAVLEQMRGEPESVIRQALRDAYPWPPRQGWPYAVWLSEIRRQWRGAKRCFPPQKRRRKKPPSSAPSLTLSL